MNATAVVTTVDEITMGEMADIWQMVTDFNADERDAFRYIGSGISRETYGFTVTSGRRFVVEVTRDRYGDQSTQELKMSAQLQTHPILRRFAAPAFACQGHVIMPMVEARDGVTWTETSVASAILVGIGFHDCHPGNYAVTSDGPVMFDLGFSASLARLVENGTLDSWTMPDDVQRKLDALQTGDVTGVDTSDSECLDSSPAWSPTTPECDCTECERACRSWRWTPDNCTDGTPESTDIGERQTQGTRRPGGSVRADRLRKAIARREAEHAMRAERAAERVATFVFKPITGCWCGQCNEARAERMA